MKKNLNKVLLIAYACEPNKGSEPGVGWNIALELCQYYDIYVVTRVNNKKLIEKITLPNNIKFIYVDLPQYLIKIKKYIGIIVYYIIWQFLVIIKIKKINIKYDILYLLTFGNLLYPNLFPLFFKNHFIWGPVGFGYNAPLKYWKYYSFRGKINEFFRFIIKIINLLNPLFHIAIRKTDIIFTVSRISYNYIKSIYPKANIIILSQVGISNDIREYLKNPIKKLKCDKKDSKDSDSFIIMIAGRLVHWKGFGIAILAFNEFLKKVKSAKMIIVGDGYELNYIKKLIKKLKIEDNITIYKEMNYYEYLELLKSIDIFVYPSLHEPGAFVLAEALFAGKKIVCFKYGEPDEIVPDVNNIKINISYGWQGISEGLLKLYSSKLNNTYLYNNEVSTNEINSNFSWSKKAFIISQEIQKVLNENSSGS
ncbi:MAG: glycosyltransferase [Melioribacteraceae bacterium]